MPDEATIQLKRLADLGWTWYHNLYPDRFKEPPLTVVRLNEHRINEMDIQQFAFNLVARKDDVIRREVTLTIPDDIAVPNGFPRVQRRVAEGSGAGTTGTDTSEGRNIETDGAFEAPEGATVKVSTVAVDNAGNLAPETVQEYTAIDTIAPVAEGELEAVRLGERQA